MADVILFHHALGLTAGVLEFAQQLRSAGHRVEVPDLYDGKLFTSIEDGVAHAQVVGFDQIMQRGVDAANKMPSHSVYAGFSLGVMPAQKLAQTRAGALGALLYYSAIPSRELGSSWPDGVGLQIHVTENDKWEPLEPIRELAGDVKDSELFIYPGTGHLVADSSFGQYDAEIAGLILNRSVTFLNRWP